MPDINKAFFWSNGEYLDFFPNLTKNNKVIVENIGVYNGRPFLLDEHIKQFLDSHKFFLFDQHFSQETIKNICLELIETNKLEDANLNLILSLSEGRENLSISFNKKKKLTKDFKNITGLKVDISPPSNSTNFNKNIQGFLIPSYINKKKSIEQGFDDVLMLDKHANLNMTSEGNIFFFKGDSLITSFDERSFDPVTKRAIVRIANSLNIEVLETNIKQEDLSNYTEAFIVNAKYGIRHISSIENYNHYCSSLTQNLYIKFYERAYNYKGDLK